MSGKYGPHLCRRNGIFHFKMKVPVSIKSQLGLSEVSRSLRTYSKFEARIGAARAAARLKRIWNMLQNTEFSREIGRQIINEIFEGLEKQTEDHLFAFYPTQAELDQQLACIEERLAFLDNNPDAKSLQIEADRIINDNLLKRGIPPTSVSDAKRRLLREWGKASKKRTAKAIQISAAWGGFILPTRRPNLRS